MMLFLLFIVIFSCPLAGYEHRGIFLSGSAYQLNGSTINSASLGTSFAGDTQISGSVTNVNSLPRIYHVDPWPVAWNSNQSLYYATAQLAVNGAASGDTIYLLTNTASAFTVDSKTNLNITSLPGSMKSVTGSSDLGNGLTIQNSLGINISALAVTGWSNGIYITNSQQVKLFGNNISTNKENGVHISSASCASNIFTANTILSNYWGLYIQNSSWNSISSNELSYNYIAGLYLQYTSNNSVFFNTASSNMYHAMQTTFSGSNAIFSNALIGYNGGNGLYDSISSNNNVFSNYITKCNLGARFYNSHYNKIWHNTSVSNSAGMQIQLSSYNNIYSNTILKNSYTFEISKTAKFNTVYANRLESGLYGIIITNSAHSNYILNNTIHSNGAYGLLAAESIGNVVAQNNFLGQNYALLLSNIPGNLYISNNHLSCLPNSGTAIYEADEITGHQIISNIFYTNYNQYFYRDPGGNINLANFELLNAAGDLLHDANTAFGNILEPPYRAVIASYRFNNNYNDDSGNNYHCTPSGSPAFTIDRFNSLNSAAGFQQGDSDYLSSSYTSQLPTDYSFAAWIKPANITAENPVLSKSPVSVVHGYLAEAYMRLETTGNVRFVTGSLDAWSWAYAESIVKLRTNNWYHIAATYSNACMRIYVNGRLEGISTNTYTRRYSTDPIRIAQYDDGGAAVDAYFDGNIDDVIFANYTLTYEEITNYYQSNLTFYAKNITTGLGYENLQVAIDCAQPGEEIRLVKGSYTRGSGISAETNAVSIFCKTNIIIRGGFENDFITRNNGNYSILNSGNQAGGRVMIITNCNSLTIDGFAFTGGEVDTSSANGGGCYMQNCSGCAFSNIIMSNNQAEQGGALFALLMYSNTISGIFASNNSAWNGGGIYLSASVSNTLDLIVTNNNSTAAGSGGGGGLI
ncbi:MAG TPA: hypothetical protein DC049_19345, partial [Spirochaetia bacterium]|nr:hypothetical protein [Spirochaetia bacterium]